MAGTGGPSSRGPSTPGLRERSRVCAPGFVAALVLAGGGLLPTGARSGLAAQAYNFHQYTVREGLPQSQVLSLHQDREGYIWFGTYGGLGRYDGASIRTYTSADGLSSNVIAAMAEYGDGRLVVGTLGGGVCIREEGDFRCLSVSDGLPATDVTALLFDGSGTLWMATGAGLVRWAEGGFTLFTTTHGLPATEVLSLAADPHGRIWVGTARGPAVRTDDGFEPVGGDRLAGLRAETLLTLPERTLVGTDGGLWEFDDSGARRLPLPAAAADAPVRGLGVDSEGRIWAATARGLLRIDGADVLSLDEANGLPVRDLLGLMVDREDNVWVSHDAGASKLVPGPFRGYGTPEGLPNPFARALAEDRDGRLWVGTRDGAAAWSPRERRFVVTVPGSELPDPRIYALARAPEGGMLVGSRGGLVHWRAGELRLFGGADGLPSPYVLSLEPDPAGGVWIGTEAGLARWDSGAVVPFPAGHPLSGLFAVNLAVDAEGRLWIGLASEGVRIWDGGTLRVLDEAAGLTDQVVWSIAPDGEGGMWVGTNGDGAFRVSDAGIRRFTSRDGLTNDFVWQVLTDSRGATWFYTNQGLDRFREGEFRYFGEAEGLVDLEGTAGAALESSNGQLWFGTARGIVAYDPEEEYRNRIPPAVRIEEVAHEGVPLDPAEPFRFGPGLVHIRFGALTFRDERGVRFRYRLARGERSAGGWSPLLREHSVSFGSLPPGTHTFEVIAVNRDGVTSSEPASVTFTVRPPWWRSRWALFLGIGLLAGLGAGVPLLRSRRLEAERRRLAAIVAERTAELEEANERLRREIRERERFETELQSSEARLRRIVENSTIVFYSHTPDHELTYISPQVEELLGVPPEEVPERWTEFATDHPMNERGVETTLKALETGERQPPYELELRHADGRLVRVRVTEAPVMEDGEAVGMVGSLTDVTEAHRAEEEKARLEARLRQAQRMEAVGRLAGGIAHGFNNLLTAIVGRVDLMGMELPPDHPLQEDVREVNRACGRAASLVAQLLALGRRQMIRPEARSLNAAVEEARPTVAEALGDGVALEIRPSPEDPWVHMDRGQLDEILMQLARNAGEAMPTGGRLAISTGTARLADPPDGTDDPDFRPGEFAVLTIEDTGPGMDAEAAAQAFEPFYTTREQAEGAGLGLATVYGIVRQNRGFIQLETAPGSGATFRIYLPTDGSDGAGDSET